MLQKSCKITSFSPFSQKKKQKNRKSNVKNTLRGRDNFNTHNRTKSRRWTLIPCLPKKAIVRKLF